MNIEWAQSIVRQCKAARVPVFVKQLGKSPVKPMGANATLELNAFTGCVAPRFHQLFVSDAKGNNPEEWPADLRLREIPQPLEAHADNLTVDLALECLLEYERLLLFFQANPRTTSDEAKSLKAALRNLRSVICRFDPTPPGLEGTDARSHAEVT